jgi:hypothetical protein
LTPTSEYEIGIGAYRFDPAAGEPELPEALQLSVGAEPASDRLGSFLVQFTRPLTTEARARLQNQYGLGLRHYIPNLAYLEQLSPDAVGALESDDLVRAVVPYQPAFKLAPLIGRVPARTDERRMATDTPLDATLFDNADPRRVTTQLTEAGASGISILDDRALGGRLRVRFRLTDLSSLEQIASIEDLQWVEEVAESVDDNVEAAGTIQSGSAVKHSIWDKGLHGEGQVIGVLDNGPLDIGHCFFEDPASNNPGPGHRKVRALRNASGSAPGPHATFVSGCAAGDDFNNPGASAHRGGAWASQLVSGNRVGMGTLFAELAAAAGAGASIHSNSWHDNTAGVGQPALYNQNAADVDAFTWNNEDHLVLGSAGNTGEQQGPPGTAKNAICVSAARADPDEMDLGDGNPGPTADGRRKPDLVTVGCGIESATVNTPCGTDLRACATSWATPHAAAAAALVRQYFRDGWYPDGEPAEGSAWTPSGALLKAVLINSTLNMTGVPGYPSNDEGWGIVRLDDVLTFPGSARALTVWERRNANGLSTGDARVHHVDVVNGVEPLKVTLVWTEPPGTAGAASPIVNNLDLQVTSPDGSQTFLGNNFAGGSSTVGGAPDRLNNVEVVVVTSPTIGRWTIRVVAVSVNVGNPAQGYAVVATTGRPDWLSPMLHVMMR